MASQPSSEQKFANRLAFDHYLRTGEQLTTAQWLERIEKKFNPNHDELGRFTSAFGAVVPGQGSEVARMGQGAAGGKTVQPPLDASPKRLDAGSQPVAQPRTRIAEVPGYPQDRQRAWRSANDAAFIAAADLYNRKYGLRPGTQGYRTLEFMKAWAMRESGGEGDREAFLTDPFQVNNPGDWTSDKREKMRLSRDQ